MSGLEVIDDGMMLTYRRAQAVPEAETPTVPIGQPESVPCPPADPQIVVLCSNIDGGWCRIFRTLDAAKLAIIDFVVNEGDDPERDVTVRRVVAELGAISALSMVESVRGSDAWKERFYLAMATV